MFALGSLCLLWCCQGRHGTPAGQAQQLRGYKLFMKVYLCIPEQGTFEAVPGMPYHLPQQICEAQDVLQQIDRAGAAAVVCFQQRPQHLAEHLHLARMLLLLLVLMCCCLLVLQAFWLSLLHSLLKRSEQLVYAWGLMQAVVF